MCYKTKPANQTTNQTYCDITLYFVLCSLEMFYGIKTFLALNCIYIYIYHIEDTFAVLPFSSNADL